MLSLNDAFEKINRLTFLVENLTDELSELKEAVDHLKYAVYEDNE